MVNNGSVSPKRLTLLLAAPSLGLMFVICINSLIKASFEELQRFEHPPKDDGSLGILVIGDWGRNGYFNQSKVVLQMGRIGEKLEIDFVISTGDNFYENGLNGVGDPAFQESFTKIYTAKSLQKQWYSRNHDYRGDTKAQLSPVLRKINSRWLGLRSFIVNAETAEFFFVDTTPFVVSYFFEKDHTYDWQGVFPRGTYLVNLLNDLEMSLRESSAKWKIVVGHHAIISAGHHGDTPELIHPLLPLLEANNVDFYINGHDHSLEHISSKTCAIQFLTSRAGSKAWRGDMKKISNHAAVKFFYDGQGFMSLQLTREDAEFVFYDVFGKVLHNCKVPKNSYSSI